MAALQASVNLPSTALVAATAKTVLMITAAANQRVKILGFSFFGDSATNAQPIQCRIGRATSAGTFTSTPPVPVEKELTESIQTTGGTNATAEPTYGDIIKTITIHPQLGYEFLAPLGQEYIVQGGGRFAFELTAPAGVNVRGHVAIEE